MLVPYDIVVVSVLLAFAAGMICAAALFQLVEDKRRAAERRDRAKLREEPREWR